MDLVVENEFYTKKKVQCERHKIYLAKVPKDYQVMCLKVKESRTRCKRKSYPRCPVGLNQSNYINFIMNAHQLCEFHILIR